MIIEENVQYKSFNISSVLVYQVFYYMVILKWLSCDLEGHREGQLWNLKWKHLFSITYS